MSSLMGNYSPMNVAFVKGEGIYLFDTAGKRYIDFGSGISVTNLGHCHPHVTKALQEQAGRLWHTSNLFVNQLQQSLADRLSKASFGGELFFANSGAEANECAIKLARMYNNKVHGGRKPRIITMLDSFHGRTYMTMSATGQDKIQKGFEPILQDFSYVPFNDLAALEAELAKGDVCAVMLELYQGESGVIAADADYVRAIRKLTKEQNILMIVDEVQTGYGRSGKMFAYQHLDVIPDVITMAKAIANGLPMGACAAAKHVSQYFTAGTHGSTFGGTFLACATAHAVLDVMLADGFLDEVARKGELFQKMLRDAFGDKAIVRGKGMLVGVVPNVNNREYIQRCLNEGLVLIAGGAKAVRFYPPLTATEEELRAGVEIAARVLHSF